jgi:hypothetical protein
MRRPSYLGSRLYSRGGSEGPGRYCLGPPYPTTLYLIGSQPLADLTATRGWPPTEKMYYHIPKTRLDPSCNKVLPEVKKQFLIYTLFFGIAKESASNLGIPCGSSKVPYPSYHRYFSRYCRYSQNI